MSLTILPAEDVPETKSEKLKKAWSRRRGREKREINRTEPPSPKTAEALKTYAFRPGYDPRRNPGGGAGRRRTSLARYIREKHGANGEELVDFVTSVLRGEIVEVGIETRDKDGKRVSGETVIERPSVADRLKAAMWLADRGWGKPVDTTALEEEFNRAGAAGRHVDFIKMLAEIAKTEPDGSLLKFRAAVHKYLASNREDDSSNEDEADE